MSRAARGIRPRTFINHAMPYIAETIKERSKNYKQLSLSGRVTNRENGRELIKRLQREVLSLRVQNQALQVEHDKSKPSLFRRIFGGD